MGPPAFGFANFTTRAGALVDRLYCPVFSRLALGPGKGVLLQAGLGHRSHPAVLNPPSLAAWTDHEPPHHVDQERYGDKDYEYLYWSQWSHGHIMH